MLELYTLICLVQCITMDFLPEYHLYLRMKYLNIGKKEEEMILLRIAITLSSFKISIEPREIKYIEVKISPRCVIISPGGA